jgi:hypothetical protein
MLCCRTEMNVLQKVHHPHTVQFFGAVTKQTPYMIVTEFMSCGSMSDMFRCALRCKDLAAVPRSVVVGGVMVFCVGVFGGEDIFRCAYYDKTL